MTWAGSIINNVSESMTLRRKIAGSYDSSGKYIEGSYSDIIITGSIQPASQRDLEMLAEGRRISEGMKLYTTTDLKTASPSTGVNADIIIYRGREFEVVAVRNWYQTTEFYKAILKRLGDG